MIYSTVHGLNEVDDLQHELNEVDDLHELNEVDDQHELDEVDDLQYSTWAELSG